MQTHRAYDGAEWVYGTSFERDTTDYSLWWYLNDNEQWNVVGKPETSLRRLDKNGKETFLHDIIKHTYGVGVIKYDKYEYYIEWRNGVMDECPFGFIDDTYEVIGNLTEEKL